MYLAPRLFLAVFVDEFDPNIEDLWVVGEPLARSLPGSDQTPSSEPMPDLDINEDRLAGTNLNA